MRPVSPQYPLRALELPNIKVLIEISSERIYAKSEYALKIQRVAYSLAVFFQDSKVQTCQVTFSPDIRSAPLNVQKALLYPFAKLPPTAKLIFVGATESICDYIESIRGIKAVQYNPLAEYRRLSTRFISLRSKFAPLSDQARGRFERVKQKFVKALRPGSMINVVSDNQWTILVLTMQAFEALPANVTEKQFQQVYKEYTGAFNGPPQIGPPETNS